MEKVGYYGYRGKPFGHEKTYHRYQEEGYYIKLWLEEDIITKAEVVNFEGAYLHPLGGWINNRKPSEWTEVFTVGDPDLRMDEGL